MRKSNFYTRKKDSFTNSKKDCHCTGGGCRKNSASSVSETNSDQDSANSKYVVEDDKRERRDGPGGD
ncbi:MAG: hypothetical protein K2K56_00735 [Lachnospiraceae bacterium]|nr:hypothetical protein [Lachnospiraceae bacterium]